ncbi:MAG: hypothetical protein ABSG84_16720 [Acidobacteriaceae bacterium]|jgi:hypothetical protein
MRRSLLALLLLLSFAYRPQTYAQTPASQSESDQLRAAAQKLLATGSTADAMQAAELLDKASEIDARDAATLASKAQVANLQQPAESVSKQLIDLTPFLSFVILALTFIFNGYQARAADREKREEAIRQSQADEEKRFTDAITLIQKTEQFSPAAALLSTFSTGPYATLARQAGVNLLLHTRSFDNFRDLFNSFIEPVTRENLNQVLDLLRTVSITVGPLLSKAWVNNATDLTSLTPAEVASYNLLVQERIFLGTKVAVILRQPRASLDPIDLSDIGFDATDLTGADLRASIAPATWNWVNLDGADLRGMTGFQNSWFYTTAWWHASHIDEPFLSLLAERFGFKEGQASNTPQGISAEDYRVNLERLKAQAQQAERTAASA